MWTWAHTLRLFESGGNRSLSSSCICFIILHRRHGAQRACMLQTFEMFLREPCYSVNSVLAVQRCLLTLWVHNPVQALSNVALFKIRGCGGNKTTRNAKWNNSNDRSTCFNITICFALSLPQITIFHLRAVVHLRSEKMAAIPSSGSLIATHDYYRSESDMA